MLLVFIDSYEAVHFHAIIRYLALLRLINCAIMLAVSSFDKRGLPEGVAGTGVVGTEGGTAGSMYTGDLARPSWDSRRRGGPNCGCSCCPSEM